MFKNDWTSVTVAERSGRPSTSTTDDRQEEARAIILADGRLTTEQIELQLGFSQKTAYFLVLDIVGVPKRLMEEHKPNTRTSATVFWSGTAGKVITS
jgi:hypothetical protein